MSDYRSSNETEIELHRLDLQEQMLRRKMREVAIRKSNIKKTRALKKLKADYGLKSDDHLLAIDDLGWCYPIGTLMRIVGAGIYSDGLSVDVQAVDGHTIIACVPLDKILAMRKSWETKHGDLDG